MKKLKIILQSNIFFFFCLFLSIAVCSIAYFFPQNSVYHGDETEMVGRVLKYKIDGDQLSFVLESREKLMVFYRISSEEEKNSLLNTFGNGLLVRVKGKLELPSPNTIPNTFNYQKYLHNQKIYFLFQVDYLEVINSENFFQKIRNQILRYARSLEHSDYFLAFLLGDTSTLDMSDLRANGVSHLFAVSGMHISLFVAVLSIFLKRWKKIGKIFIALILAFYAFLAGFSPSVLRALFLYYGKEINDLMDHPVTNQKLFCLIFLFMLLFHPFYLMDLGFQYSFLISFCFLFLEKDNNYWKNLLQSSTIAFFASIPISAIHFYEVNFLSILLNLLFVPFITFLLYPLCIITFIFPFLMPVFSFFLSLFEFLNTTCSAITFAHIIIPKVSFFWWGLYFLFFFLFLKTKRKQYFLSFFLLLLSISFSSRFHFSSFVYFLDVGQGDATLFLSPFQKEVVLIDTGGKISYEKEKWQKKVKTVSQADTLITFLHSLGISKINTLIFTHGDVDHAGNALSLLEKIKVEQIVLNHNSFNNLETQIMNRYKRKIVNTWKSDFFQIQEFTSYDATNENDASLIYQIGISKFKFLMMGDASQTIEKRLLNKNISSNVIKLGHHGSKTSSDISFLKQVNPNYAIISAGKNNRYGHPNKQTLAKLQELHIPYYETSKHGTILFEITKGEIKIS